MSEFSFSVTLLATIRVSATSELAARKMLADAFYCAESNFGYWPDGAPILAEASIEGGADLAEVDGEPVS